MKSCVVKRFSEYPQMVEIYKKCYEKMATPEYKAELINFAKSFLHDPIENLDWKELLDWEHRNLKYTREELPKPRAELPIDIIHQSKGRCGEFALLYNGLLLANEYRSRIVVDCSTLKDKSKKAAGDHVWVEVFINNHWVHVDPTEKRIDQPLIYANEWNKDVNLVYALTSKETVDVTKTYKPK
ncbi:MAG: transglutaminase domain-containing protein [Candidatus Bathyarchaeia archaeon]